MQEVKNLVSFLCAPPFPERPLGDNSLLTAEGDLEQRGSTAENLEPSAGPEAVFITSKAVENLEPCLSGPSAPEAVIITSKAAENLETSAEPEAVFITAKAVEILEPYLSGPSDPDDSLLRAEGDLEQRVGTVAGARVRRRCQPYARLMGGGALAPPSPFGAVATAGPTNFSDPFACHKHQGRKSWSISEACEACIALVDSHGNNYGRNFPQALIKEGADGFNIWSDACNASGSACTARPGSPVSAQGGPPSPPPLSGVRSAQKGEGWVVHL